MDSRLSGRVLIYYRIRRYHAVKSWKFLARPSAPGLGEDKLLALLTIEVSIVACRAWDACYAYEMRSWNALYS